MCCHTKRFINLRFEFDLLFEILWVPQSNGAVFGDCDDISFANVEVHGEDIGGVASHEIPVLEIALIKNRDRALK